MYCQQLKHQPLLTFQFIRLRRGKHRLSHPSKFWLCRSCWSFCGRSDTGGTLTCNFSQCTPGSTCDRKAKLLRFRSGCKFRTASWRASHGTSNSRTLSRKPCSVQSRFPLLGPWLLGQSFAWGVCFCCAFLHFPPSSVPTAPLALQTLSSPQFG